MIFFFMISEQNLKISIFWKKTKNYFRSEKKCFFFEMKFSIDLGFFCAWVPERLLYACAILEQVQGYKFSCESDLDCRIHTKSVTIRVELCWTQSYPIQSESF